MSHPHPQVLGLESNRIGDKGFAALGRVAAFEGALDALRILR